MPKPRILQEDREYTFRSYFEMIYEPEEILAEFGYHLVRAKLSLPKTQKPLDRSFGLLDVEAKRITEDIKIYSLPDDLEALMLTLVGIVERSSEDRVA